MSERDDFFKLAGGLISSFKKAKKDGFVDPRSEEFAASRAFGKSILPALGISSTALGALIAKKPRLVAALLAAGPLAGAGVYATSKSKFRKMQAKGLNPATGKPHDTSVYARAKALGKKYRETEAKSKGGKKDMAKIQKAVNENYLKATKKAKTASASKDDLFKLAGQGLAAATGALPGWGPLAGLGAEKGKGWRTSGGATVGQMLASIPAGLLVSSASLGSDEHQHYTRAGKMTRGNKAKALAALALLMGGGAAGAALAHGPNKKSRKGGKKAKLASALIKAPTLTGMREELEEIHQDRIAMLRRVLASQEAMT